MGSALAVVTPMAVSITEEKRAWELMRDQASILIKTGFLPEAIKTPEQAIHIMMKGRELGIPATYALSNIAVVKGKPSCSAELMLALIRRDHGPHSIRVKASSNQACTVEWRTPGWDGTQTYEFTIDDAKMAGLVQPNSNWTKYPAAMLRARCISAVARMAFPESIAGMYSPGELGEPVTVTDDGEVLSNATGSVLGELVDYEVDFGSELIVETEFVPAAPPPSEPVRVADPMAPMTELPMEPPPSEQPAPWDQHPGDGEAELPHWTAFWNWARPLGYQNKRDIEAAIGGPIPGVPEQAKRAILAARARS